jgi:hypothetical protein
MTKLLRLLWISFLSVFPTTRLLENVEGEIEKIFENDQKKQTPKPSSTKPEQDESPSS